AGTSPPGKSAGTRDPHCRLITGATPGAGPPVAAPSPRTLEEPMLWTLPLSRDAQTVAAVRPALASQESVPSTKPNPTTAASGARPAVCKSLPETLVSGSTPEQELPTKVLDGPLDA